ncbi:MAG: PEGA domain-containing protein [Candidatus Binatia bacterium]
MLSSLQSGTYVVEITLEGYTPRRETVELGEGELRELRFRFGYSE